MKKEGEYTLWGTLSDLVTELCPNGAFSCLSGVRGEKEKIPQNLDFAGFVIL